MLSEEGQKDIFLGVEGETYEVVDGKPQLTDEMIELMNSDPNTFATQYGLVDTYWMLRNSVIVDSGVGKSLLHHGNERLGRQERICERRYL